MVLFHSLCIFLGPSAVPIGVDHKECAVPDALYLPLALDLVPIGVKRAIIMHDVISSLRLVIHFQEADRASFPAAVNYRMQRLSMAGDQVRSLRCCPSHTTRTFAQLSFERHRRPVRIVVEAGPMAS